MKIDQPIDIHCLMNKMWIAIIRHATLTHSLFLSPILENFQHKPKTPSCRITPSGEGLLSKIVFRKPRRYVHVTMKRRMTVMRLEKSKIADCTTDTTSVRQGQKRVYQQRNIISLPSQGMPAYHCSACLCRRAMCSSLRFQQRPNSSSRRSRTDPRPQKLITVATNRKGCGQLHLPRWRRAKGPAEGAPS